MDGPPTPADCRLMAKLCLRVWGETVLAAMPGQEAEAVAAWILMRSATASVLIFLAVPRAVNTKLLGAAGFSRCHCRSPVTAGALSGVRRSFRPLPCQRTWAPGRARDRSSQVRAVTSHTRGPLVSMGSIRRRSRRPVQVAGSGAASRSSASSPVILYTFFLDGLRLDRQDLGDE